MKDDTVIGHEALVRGPMETPLEFPDALFQMARNTEKVPELDILCMQKALVSALEFQRGLQLFLNVYPETLDNADLLFRQILRTPSSPRWGSFLNSQAPTGKRI